MKDRPVLFTVTVFFAGLAAAVAFSLPFLVLGFETESSTAIGRIASALLFLFLFRRYFGEEAVSGRRAGNHWLLTLPALAFLLWNVVYNGLSGCEIAPVGSIPGALLLGFAPGLFEEILFRGICIPKCLECGKSRMSALWITSLIFAAVHLTNIAGGDVPGTLLQTVYSLAAGLMFGAVCLYTGSVVPAIVAHTLTDFSDRVFASTPASTPVPLLAAFCVVLAASGAYAVWLTCRHLPRNSA